jgi:glycyl-tRNA synthetase
MGQEDDLKKIVSLCKRRGFVYPGSDLYGGFANTYSYGPLGAELKRNIKNLFWSLFVDQRDDMVGLDGPILLHPKTWDASGHVAGFNDALIDCKSCKARLRVDHLLEACLHMETEGLSLQELGLLSQKEQVVCPKCGKHEWTEPRHFNLMFSTHISKTSQRQDDAVYLRPETAQAIFLDFKNVVDTMRVQVPFGIAQIGKAFRNEITPGNFLFRQIEFEQMEIEYFIHETQWQSVFESWLGEMKRFCHLLGLPESSLSFFEHPQEKLSHYSKRTVDVMYQFPFGRSELFGLAYRTNFDLMQHEKFSQQKLSYLDPKTHERFVPHVIEPTFGVDRALLAMLCSAYHEETLDNGEMRTVLKFHPLMAPIKVAVFPLMKKPELVEIAEGLYKNLRKRFKTEYDDSGAIGKRYRRHDEIGTPLCITVDYQTLEDRSVTLRQRDSMLQHRVLLDDLAFTIEQHLHSEL